VNESAVHSYVQLLRYIYSHRSSILTAVYCHIIKLMVVVCYKLYFHFFFISIISSCGKLERETTRRHTDIGHRTEREREEHKTQREREREIHICQYHQRQR
jgi:hypothetical protein